MVEALQQAQTRGLVGGDLGPHLAHALGFVEVLRSPDPPASVLDLGSGGGLPGLVIADVLGQARVTLVESSESRCRLLRAAVDACGWGPRVQVCHERAELAGRRAELRGSFEAVVARSFGRPAVVAECGAPFLSAGGVLVVSEPPDRNGAGEERWPEAGLALVGLAAEELVEEPYGYQVLRLIAPCPDRYPRRPGVPAKRPLF